MIFQEGQRVQRTGMVADTFGTVDKVSPPETDRDLQWVMVEWAPNKREVYTYDTACAILRTFTLGSKIARGKRRMKI
jgi:hypothetical protein